MGTICKRRNNEEERKKRQNERKDLTLTGLLMEGLNRIPRIPRIEESGYRKLSQTLAIERTENLPSLGVAVTDFSSYQIGIN